MADNPYELGTEEHEEWQSGERFIKNPDHTKPYTAWARGALAAVGVTTSLDTDGDPYLRGFDAGLEAAQAHLPPDDLAAFLLAQCIALRSLYDKSGLNAEALGEIVVKLAREHRAAPDIIAEELAAARALLAKDTK
jgi:hypothetical protein